MKCLMACKRAVLDVPAFVTVAKPNSGTLNALSPTNPAPYKLAYTNGWCGPKPL